MELIILTSISIILIVFLVLSFINEHLGLEKFNLKSKITTSIIILLIVNLIYFLIVIMKIDIILSSNIIIVGIDILFGIN